MIPRNFLKTLLLTALSLSTAGLVQATIVIDEGLDNSGVDSAIGLFGKAVNFVMGPGDDYNLTSVVLGIGNVNGGADPIVQLWSDDGSGAPIGSLLETLTDPGTFATGVNTFTSSGTTLSASTAYWIVVTNENSNSFEWLGDNTDTVVGSDIGATHTARLFGSSGSQDSWNSSSSVLNQIQVNATVVPEPSSFALLSGLMAFGWMACRRRR